MSLFISAPASLPRTISHVVCLGWDMAGSCGVGIADMKQSRRDYTLQRALLIDPGKCTGCLQCEMACSFEHTGAFNPSRSLIRVLTFHQ
jgi:NAD-dependent dihydropyrimidine dehydrogenase PreA subunit